MEELENKELCKTCGRCCKKSGCDYYVEDFENFKINYLEKKLREGNISIVAALHFSIVNGKTVRKPFLYLRARNKHRDVVDLLSLKTTCASLTETGCSYDFEHRPSGGKYLVPRKNGECISCVDMQAKILEYMPYQDVLAKLVKRFTNKTVMENLRFDVISLFYDIANNNFEDVSKEEIQEVKEGLLPLISAFPVEASIAKKIISGNIGNENVLAYKPNTRGNNNGRIRK